VTRAGQSLLSAALASLFSLKTVEALDIKLPPSIRQRADKVIE